MITLTPFLLALAVFWLGFLSGYSFALLNRPKVVAGDIHVSTSGDPRQLVKEVAQQIRRQQRRGTL